LTTEKSVWIKRHRIGVRLGIMQEFPYIGNDGGSLWDEVTVVDVILHETVREVKRNDRMPPENFLDQSIDVR